MHFTHVEPDHGANEARAETCHRDEEEGLPEAPPGTPIHQDKEHTAEEAIRDDGPGKKRMGGRRKGEDVNHHDKEDPGHAHAEGQHHQCTAHVSHHPDTSSGHGNRVGQCHAPNYGNCKP